MSKFKVGDKVRCVRPCPGQIEEGEIGEVAEVVDNGLHQMVRLVGDERTVMFFVERFELVESPKLVAASDDILAAVSADLDAMAERMDDEPSSKFKVRDVFVSQANAPKFKVGDRIRRAAGYDLWAWPTPGHVYVVKEVPSWTHVIVEGMGRLEWENERFELVPEDEVKSKTVAVVKPRVVETKWGPVEVERWRCNADLVVLTYDDGVERIRMSGIIPHGCDPEDPNFVARVIADHESLVDTNGETRVEDVLITMQRIREAQLQEQAEAEFKTLPGPGTDAEWGEP